MSEPIPESVPTSQQRRGPPTKRAKLTPVTAQANQLEALFANPDHEIVIPSGGQTRRVAAPPEIVANVQGSSAGAGSGEFHVYKASRRREYERLRAMDEENEREKAEAEYKRHQEDLKAKEQDKLDKNRAKREKAKARAMKAKSGNSNNEISQVEKGISPATETTAKKKKFGGPVQLPQKDADGKEEETQTTAEDEGGTENGVVIHDDD